MLLCFIFAVIAAFVNILNHIEPIAPAESSLVETIVTEITTTSHTTGYTSTSTTTETTSSSTSSIATTESITSSTIGFETTTITTTKDDVIVITGYQIIVIPDETSKATTKTTKTTTATTTTYSVTTVTTTTTVGITVKDDGAPNASRRFVKTFSRGTYYPGWEGYGSTQIYGGSGRLLMDCSIKDDEIKGSVACKYIQEKYGYNYNGDRTIVYLDIPELPDMSGFYFIDDSCLRYDTIDFYFTYKANCPFENQGVLTNISCYIFE